MNENHILVGIGGTGGKILKAFRKRLYQEFPAEERANLSIGFLYIDSSVEMMQPDDKTWYVLGEYAQFDKNEFVNIKGIDLASVFSNPSSFPGLKGFIGDPEVMQKTLGEVGAAAAQKRRAGRILFGANIDQYKQALRAQYNKVNQLSRATRTNLYIFSGLAGGTGSGSIVDVIAETRMMPEFREPLSPDGKSGTGIVVTCMVPELTPPGKADAGRYHANGFAALTELNALQVGSYKPHDLTGVSERLNLDGIRKIADGLILYSNVNENGVIVDSLKELPKIVSDFTYNRIFLENNDNTEEFIRSYSFENIDDWRNEYYEKAKNNQIIPYRTKAVSSFGIKRIIIPEDEIVEYFTYTFGRQALLQMRFDNWNDDLGYRETPANKDFHSYVRGEEKGDNPLEKWRLTDKHLILDLPILPGDEGKWGTFSAYWSGNMPRWAETAQEAKQPLNRLQEMCERGYKDLFRNVGVKSFFEGKTAAREEHANEITDLIEKFIFEKWSMGDLSLYNMTQLMDCIIEYVGAQRKAFEGRATKVNQLIDNLNKEREASAKDYAGSIIRATFIKGRLILRHSEILQKLYVKRTEAEGIQFAIGLMGMLTNKLNQLRGRIEQFTTMLSEAIAQTETLIGSRCQDQTNVKNLSGAVIRFYNQPQVVAFAKSVMTDKKRQKGISDEVRNEIINLIGSERTFARANASVNTEIITKVLDTVVRRKSVAIHEEILTESNEKLINRSIFEQLSEHYRTPEELRTFAEAIMKESGVFLELNPTELKRAIPNNPNPEQGKNIHRKIVLVNLPSVEGNELVQDYAKKLKNALTSAAEAGLEVKVDLSGSRRNEMIVSVISYCFPIRTLKNLPFFKERYDYLITNPNEARQNKTVLHTEGTGEQFPTLFVAAEKLKSQLREEYTPYLILAHALGVLKYGDIDDGTGRKAYGTVEEDDLGMEVLMPYAEKFTEIGYSEKFTEEFCEELKSLFEQAVKTEYLNVQKRQTELKPKVQALIKEVILPECGGNQGSEQFLFFRAAALKALELLK